MALPLSQAALRRAARTLRRFARAVSASLGALAAAPRRRTSCCAAIEGGSRTGACWVSSYRTKKGACLWIAFRKSNLLELAKMLAWQAQPSGGTPPPTQLTGKECLVYGPAQRSGLPTCAPITLQTAQECNSFKRSLPKPVISCFLCFMRDRTIVVLSDDQDRSAKPLLMSCNPFKPAPSC